MKKQKNAAAIHDITGFGRCSLTVALPILSAAGVQTSVIPTAILSTHPGGFTGYTYRDLTDDLPSFAEHWKSLGLKFDALYSGFLGSFEQLTIVSDIFDLLTDKDCLILVDPAMADNGKLYHSFTPDYAKGMAELCAKADIIVPNLTEAALMLGREYREGPFDKAGLQELLESLSLLGPEKVVLTGIQLDDGRYGAAGFERSTKRTCYAFSEKIEGYFHGTGDIFGSALLSGLLNDLSFGSALSLAVDFTASAILRTRDAGTDTRYGVNFEAGIPEFTTRLGLHG